MAIYFCCFLDGHASGGTAVFCVFVVAVFFLRSVACGCVVRVVFSLGWSSCLLSFSFALSRAVVLCVLLAGVLFLRSFTLGPAHPNREPHPEPSGQQPHALADLGDGGHGGGGGAPRAQRGLLSLRFSFSLAVSGGK